ncbi:hypothetical protein Gohar_011602 [Gossypium harknessii]|uniref:Glycosyltransferase N-terminal domain-containing protein n=1 Tax=Gossypium harknessii TaxID=34285 RepID=A0A7J9GWR4_9ROSI|nr:hypothetical protein [Gossypium harknessii]
MVTNAIMEAKTHMKPQGDIGNMQAAAGDLGNGAVHILTIPFPAAGHILPHIDFIHQLLLRGLKVTILVTPKNLHFLNPILSLYSSSNNVETLVLPFPSHPSIPPGVENMVGFPISFGPIFMEAMAELYNPLFQWFQTHPSPPVAIISDMLLSSWANTLSSNLNIHHLTFMVTNANSTLPLVRKGMKKLSPSIEQFAKNAVVPSLKSWGIIFNTFLELDGDKMEIIKEEFTEHDRLWAIGPLLPIKATNNERGGPSSIPRDEVIAWLDSCNRVNSVVFIGFGSQISLTKLQMEAIASALEESGVRFIWGIKGDSQNMVPLGFEDRLAGKGVVIKGWVPQQAILDHQAVGSYLTHCGWNSALEGLLGGALLLAWPMQVDHFDNTNLLVDELGVAIRACEGLTTVPDPNKLARVLSKSVSADQPERARAMKLRQAALDAIQMHGSSYTALNSLVETLSCIRK